MPGPKPGFLSPLLGRSGALIGCGLTIEVDGDDMFRTPIRGLMPMTAGRPMCTPMSPSRTRRHWAWAVTVQ